MYYSKIGNELAGFTNQIYALITSIIIAYQEGHKVVIVDNFRNDISKDTFTPISEIFNLSSINTFLKKNYDIIIIDKNDIEFKLLRITQNGENVTKTIIQQFFIKDKGLYVRCPGKFVVHFKINEYFIEETHEREIIIDFNSEYIFQFMDNKFFHNFNDNMFEKILKGIQYNDSFVLKSQVTIKGKCNVIHVRLENDAIVHWSKMNNMSESDYKMCLENKYIYLIKKYISKMETCILLSHSMDNKVITFLNEKMYKYIVTKKFFYDREKDAIVDLLTSKQCNNVFIGNFNIEKNRGSTFSFYSMKLLKENVTKICIDLDSIHDPEIINLI
jgi:hypothetical protein